VCVPATAPQLDLHSIAELTTYAVREAMTGLAQ
jgi:hypothetical protein